MSVVWSDRLGDLHAYLDRIGEAICTVASGAWIQLRR